MCVYIDFNHGWLMKIDNMGNIQLNTVHGTCKLVFFFLKSILCIIVGREPIRDVNEVMQLHKGRHISPEYLKENMFQLNDLFSVPQATLLSDIVQYFRDHHIK